MGSTLRRTPAAKCRGSSFDIDLNHLTVYYGTGFDPSTGFADVGFRLAIIPEPSTGVLAAFGFLALACACDAATRGRKPTLCAVNAG